MIENIFKGKLRSMADLARIPRGTSFLAKAISNDYVMQVLKSPDTDLTTLNGHRKNVNKINGRGLNGSSS